MKKILYAIKKWYYYYTRVAKVPAIVHINPNWEVYYTRDKRSRIIDEISWDETEEFKKKHAWEKAFGLGMAAEKPVPVSGMIWAYIIGYCAVLYLVLFKLILPFLSAVN